jgi:hypothetical protein
LSPSGITLSSNDKEIFVVDSKNHRIQVSSSICDECRLTVTKSNFVVVLCCVFRCLTAEVSTFASGGNVEREMVN